MNLTITGAAALSYVPLRTLARKELGYEPGTGLDDGLEAFVEWLKAES